MSNTKSFCRNLAVVFALITIAGCTVPEMLLLDSTNVHRERSVKESGYLNHQEIRKGYGKVEICLDGEKLRAEFELTSPDNFLRRILFYSLFGSEIGRIEVTQDSGYVQFQGRALSLSLHGALDTLGYSWSRGVTMHDFILAHSGVISDGLLPGSVCESREYSRCFSRVIEFNDSLKVHSLRFFLRFGSLKRITLDYSVQGKPFLIEQSHFKNGTPLQTILKADDKNYYRVTYRKILQP